MGWPVREDHPEIFTALCFVLSAPCRIGDITGKSYRLRNWAKPNSDDDAAPAKPAKAPVGSEPRRKARQQSQRPTIAAAQAATT